MDEPHLSRHYLGTQGLKVKCIPFAPPGPAEPDRGIQSHKLLAVGNWSQDAEQNVLSVVDLEVWTSPGEDRVLQAGLSSLAGWEHPGSITDLQVTQVGPGRVVLLTGSSTGAVCRVQLDVPAAPGSAPEQVQIRGEREDFDGIRLRPWRHLHTGPVAALDIRAETRQVVSVGLDGAIWILPLDGPQPAKPFVEARKSVSYSAVRWASNTSFVTAGTTGGLESWDIRQGPRPVTQSPLAWGLAGAGRRDAAQGFDRIQCLDVHPSRPHLCASGSSNGTVTVWDLRFDRPPRLCSVADQAGGGVWQVRLDLSDAAYSNSQTHPAVLFCTDGGILAHATPAPGMPSTGQAAVDSEQNSARPQLQSEASIVYQEPCGSITSFDIGPGSVDAADVFCVTDQECLLYYRRLRAAPGA
ncbi:hypothetical protein WJX72_011562 [[Myrmecia] bisecta]|uniref:Nucleoporin Nup43 n=1 Tax=[Myrmecia] bisecta TaxID=41462 RepID=A0AAW1PL14_9CHLO